MRNMGHKAALAILAAGMLLSSPVPAQEPRAELMLIPGRVMIEDASPYTTVVLKNSGDATGNYSVDLTDMQMFEDGRVEPVKAGEKIPYSAKPYLHIAPRSMSLKPGETKKLQLTLRKPSGFKDGEYRTHLRIRLIDENADQKPTSMIDDKAVSIVIKANLVMIAPIIIRQGDTSYTMRIESPALTRGEQGQHVLNLYLHVEGNRSSVGDITVEHITPNAKTHRVGFLPGVVTYREVTKRLVSVLLDVPAEQNLSSGMLKITYTAAENETFKAKAEATLALP